MILQRYIAINLVKGWFMVLLVLGSVFGLISFTQELDQTQSQYDALAAARYTLMILPNQLVSLAPVIALLGSIVAMANLDKNNELTIISCTGFPLSKLLSAITLPTLVFATLLWACMEYVTPQLQQQAENERQRLRYQNTTLIPRGGVWSTDGNRYIHLGRMERDNTPGSISLFEFDETGKLTQALRATQAKVNDNRTWEFRNVWEKKLVENELETRGHNTLEIQNLWSPRELPTLAQRPDSMNLSVLYQYTEYLQSNGQPVDKYLHPFWQRLLMPFTVFAMVLLATPISASVTGGRDRSFGLSLAIGAVLGISFYLGAQIVFALGQVLQWSVPLVAIAPALVIFLAAAYMLRRMQW
ncbi:MAG: LPS export ABC transporter permease LptG [Halioglobus sp.]